MRTASVRINSRRRRSELNYSLPISPENMPNDSVAEILARAKQRGKAMRLPYAGALLPAEAHALLQQVPDSRLVDVRTQAEWEYVGHIPESVLIEWNTFPTGQRNSDFLRELQSQVPKGDAVPLWRTLAPRGSGRHAGRLLQLLQCPRGIRGRQGR
jgi:hypothetical protein